MFVGDIFDPFSKVKTHLKVKNDQLFTDNWIFLLHRKWSMIWSLIALIIIFCYTSMIDLKPIVCDGPHTDEIPSTFLEDWCWLSGTYIIPQHIDKPVGKEVVQSGVGPDDIEKGTTKRLYNNQYIFYPVIFVLQLATFFASKCVWKHLEGGRLKNILSELTAAIIDEETMKKRIKVVTDYMSTSPSTFHNNYSYRYIFCEILNAFNIVFQFWIIDKVLHDDYLGFGWDGIAYITSLSGPGAKPTIVDPFTKLFPKLAICHLIKYGPSGNPVPQEALCVLPLNNIADKIFFAWWFWLVFLAFVTIVGLMYRILLLFSVCFRTFVFWVKTRYSGQDLKDLKYFVENSTYGDWFVLSLIHKNMDSWVFSQFMRELVMKMKDKDNLDNVKKVR